MLMLSGYYVDDERGVSFEESHSFAVCSCGYYKLTRRGRIENVRREGRLDWQLLYVANGEARFRLEDGEHTATRGHMILYRPRRPQRYHYTSETRPEVYWLHFSGWEAEGLLEELGLAEGQILEVGMLGRYRELFGQIIRELQVRPAGFFPLCAALARELLALMARERGNLLAQRESPSPVLAAMEEMHRCYRENRTVQEYAQKYNMSLCWFIRQFKVHAGVPPQQYVISIRINRARELLSNSSLNVGEVGALVGYDNPLYFSRIFKKLTGLSPSAYRSRRAGE